MGSSSAYFLANRMAPEMGRICVIEQDPTVRENFELLFCLFSFQDALIPAGPRLDLGDLLTFAANFDSGTVRSLLHFCSRISGERAAGFGMHSSGREGKNQYGKIYYESHRYPKLEM